MQIDDRLQGAWKTIEINPQLVRYEDEVYQENDEIRASALTDHVPDPEELRLFEEANAAMS